jgi:uncharacterized protein (TIGR00369 family)
MPEPPEHTSLLSGVLGFEIVDVGEELATGRFAVTDGVRQPMGVVHGGAYAAMAETLASVATYMGVTDEGQIALGQSNHTTFMRPVSEGTVHARASRRHRGRTSWVWEIEFTDDRGRLCALAQMIVAVRPARG